ncbi:hypothetical protein BJX76DRAFT_357619 [Aspergillus varians]
MIVNGHGNYNAKPSSTNGRMLFIPRSSVLSQCVAYLLRSGVPVSEGLGQAGPSLPLTELDRANQVDDFDRVIAGGRLLDEESDNDGGGQLQEGDDLVYDGETAGNYDPRQEPDLFHEGPDSGEGELDEAAEQHDATGFDSILMPAGYQETTGGESVEAEPPNYHGAPPTLEPLFDRSDLPISAIPGADCLDWGH